MPVTELMCVAEPEPEPALPSEPEAEPKRPGADLHALLASLREDAARLGFFQIGVADVDLSTAEAGLTDWLAAGFHGSMAYMQAHGLKRARPAELVPGSVRVITARMDYLPPSVGGEWQAIEWRRLAEPARANVSLYARGRDYHKVLRSRLAKLADALADRVGPIGHRAFTDSAPVMEVELAARSGIGWRGKHTLTLHRDAGSMFFLGEIYVDLPLPLTDPVDPHCGSCSACIDVCPTQAILAPYRMDARRCISYLTIEHAGAIPEALRAPIGNRIYGCDDCQLVCPWNKFARRAIVPDFDHRPGVSEASLVEAWSWSRADFERHTEGSAIRRIGHERWQRNVAVALGNALRATGDAALGRALLAGRDGATDLVKEHVDWGLAQASSDHSAMPPMSPDRERSAGDCSVQSAESPEE